MWSLSFPNSLKIEEMPGRISKLSEWWLMLIVHCRYSALCSSVIHSAPDHTC